MHRRSEVDRYLAEGLPARAEARLRKHLAGCPACRAYYDEQLLLHRALSGQALQPTGAEVERGVARALAHLESLKLTGAGVAGPRPAPFSASDPSGAPSPGWLDALLYQPGRAALALGALAVVLVAGALAYQDVDRGWLAAPHGAELAGHLLGGQRVFAGGYELPPGSSIYSDTRLEVQPGGAAELELERGGRARLFPGAVAVLAPRGERVELSAGRVWCEVDKGKGTFAVRTANAEARVLGTSFVVEAEPEGDSEVRVMSGEVEVADRAERGKVRVRSGQQTRVRRDGPPGMVSRYSPDSDRQAWERLFADLAEAIDRAASRFERLFRGSVRR